jgi:D-beta-D-heptose 7-phosphate kinase/D-beta-D-heptose 1-phosphate adenosyltransferase
MSDSCQLSELLARLSDGRVVCAGDLMLDRYVEGTVERISPEAPIPVLTVRGETAMPGGVGNVVRNLAALGVSTDLVAAIGVDRPGRELASLVAREPGVTPRLVSIPDRPTSIKTRYLAGGQQLLRADHETTGSTGQDYQASLQDDVRAALADSEGAVLALSDYGKGVLGDAVLGEMIAFARDAGHAVVVDPKGHDFDRYRGATLITPNRHELAAATGMPTETDEEVAAACRRLIKGIQVDAVLATRSERGMTLVQGKGVHHLPARAKEVYDVSGAGDTVVAVVAAALAAGAPLTAAAGLANAAAGVVVEKVGTAVAHPSEILTALHETAFLDVEAKIVAEPALLDRISAWRRRGWRIGFTNGCFDLLHPGHVSLLKQAKAACDRLVVGLNGDSSVERLKGSGRPVQNEASRAAVLGSLAAVDLVVVFHDDTPLALINTLQPDVLVKGSDYTVEQVVGAEEVQSWGGEVLLAEILSGHSTSETIRRMAS